MYTDWVQPYPELLLVDAFNLVILITLAGVVGPTHQQFMLGINLEGLINSWCHVQSDRDLMSSLNSSVDYHSDDNINDLKAPVTNTNFKSDTATPPLKLTTPPS